MNSNGEKNFRDQTSSDDFEVSRVENPSTTWRLSYNERRTQTRTASKISSTSLKSLQRLSGDDNLSLINSLLKSTKSESKLRKLLELF